MYEQENLKPAGTADDSASEPRVNPDLVVSEKRRGARPAESYVRTQRPYRRLFRGARGRLVATPESYISPSAVGRGLQGLKAVFIGRPLFSREEIHERLTKVKALAVFWF